MPAFKRFGAGDQVDNVLVLEPKYDLASGALGWRGSPEGSASLSLYGGTRRSPTGVVRSIEYQSLYPAANQLPRPRLGLPTTASINVVWMTNEVLPFTERNSQRWGEEHWDSVQRLYQDYASRDPDYVTASYDNYVLYFQRDSRNVLSIDGIPGQPTGSFTLEAWIKPFSGSYGRRFTVQSRNGLFWLGLSGSSGRLTFTGANGAIVTSSVSPQAGAWNHVAVSYDAVSYAGTVYLNLANVGSFTMTPLTGTVLATLHSIGNVLASSIASAEDLTTTGTLNTSFHGLIGESRYWTAARTYSQISSSWNARITGSALTGPTLASLVALNDGPLSLVGSFPVGSGALDQAQHAQGSPTQSGRMLGFDDRVGPSWQPSDNTSFFVPKQFAAADSSVSRMIVIDVPSAFYGRHIVPGSVRLTDRAYSSGSFGLVRTLVDDGRGGLYVSGSLCSGSAQIPAEGPGVGWNKVGNVFYSEGLVVIKDPSMLDFGRTDGASSHPADTLQISFRGQSRIPVKTLMCRVEGADYNASLNPTFVDEDDDGHYVRRNPSGSLRISTVGVYNSARELVGVARLAEPVRVRARDRINVKIKVDF